MSAPATHRYIGPPNVWGLKPGAPCRVVEARGHSGGLVIDTGNGRTYVVARQHVEPQRPAPDRLARFNFATGERLHGLRVSWWRRLLARLGVGR